MSSIWRGATTNAVSIYEATLRRALRVRPRFLGRVANALIPGLVAASSLTAAESSSIATAQTYPTRPITMIVPYLAGAQVDAVGRVLAERLRGSLGQPVIIENVSGADGSIGTGRAARAKPDGYTIDLGSMSTHVLNGALYSLQYDVLNDFTPISPLYGASYVLFARKTMPTKDLNELIAWLKANPGKASIGIPAVAFRLLSVLFQNRTGTQFTLVPYRGLATPDLVAGHIDLAFGPLTELPLMRAGSIKAYAVTSDMRLALAPDIPTFAEMGLPEVSVANWGGLFAPKGTPKDIIGTLNAAAVEALADPAVQTRLVDIGVDIFPRERQTSEALAVLQRADAVKWWPIIKEFGIVP